MRIAGDIFPIVRKYTVDCSESERLQFILDCTVLPEVITLNQKLGQLLHDSLLYLTRTLCFSIYKARAKLLGNWNVHYTW